MYGLVNKAIKGLVLQHHDEAMWQKICEKANFEEGDFLSVRSYPDELTYALVGAASEELQMTPDEILEFFGEYWILYTAQEGYREMIDISGSTFPEFIENLDMLHFRVSNIMNELKPPMFNSRTIGNQKLELEYHSDRPGLTSMVVGLLRGLGKRFNHEVEIQLVQKKVDNHRCDVFHVSWK